MHFIGTSIVLTIALNNLSVVWNGIAAASIGLAVMPAMVHIPNGYVEGLLCLGIFILLSARSTGSWKVPLSIVFAGYGFAWVGHFFFEMNKPASFVYPVYSLTGDLVMWSQVLTGAIER